MILISVPLLKWMNCFISVQTGCLWIMHYKASHTSERSCKVYSDSLILNSSLIINANILLIVVLCDWWSIYWWCAEKMAHCFAGSLPFFPLAVPQYWWLKILFFCVVCFHTCHKSLHLTSYEGEVICGILNRRYLRPARPLFIKMEFGQRRHFEKLCRMNSPS